MNPKYFSLVAPLLAALPLAAFAQSDPAHMPAIAHVDPRFQSYNVEMVEIIGGRFWKPYDSTVTAPTPSANGAAASLDPSLFEQRKPLNLSDPRLRKLAAALGPAYIRVSGTWANNVFFQDSDAPAPAQPPVGFGGALTRAEWKGVIDFAHAVDAKLVTSFSVSPGTRDANGVWNTTQAQRFVDATQQLGGTIAAAEFINEPSFPSAAGLPASYNGESYARDFAVFKPFLRKASPGTILLGPGSVGEGPKGIPIKLLTSDEMLKAIGPNSVDAFSYHFYGTVSSRCASGMGQNAGQAMGTTPDAALTEEWLGRTTGVFDFYKALRDKYDPGAPIWVTETGQTACGGDRWASTFLDSFRYLDQLGRLAQKNVQVVIHNTLAASDYALIDERSLTPRPNYWAALLWHRTMGTTVLDPGPTPSASVHLYAQCTVGQSGSVTLLALNLSRTDSAHVHLSQISKRYTLTSHQLQSHDVMINGQPVSVTSTGDVPELAYVSQVSGDVSVPSASITFFVLPAAHNSACMR